MKNAYTGFSTKETPQTEPIPGEKQVQNNAGGFVYDIGIWQTFLRFLMLGSEGGSYYVGERKLTKENALNTIKCIAEDGIRAVDLIVQISDSGRAPKNDPAIFALALAASAVDVKTRQYALAQLPLVCRIPTHLFHFNQYVEQFRGRGRTLNRAIKAWYQHQDVDKLAYAMVKYQQRDGWSHRDLLRLVRPKADTAERNNLYRWAVKGLGETVRDNELVRPNLPQIVQAFERIKGEKDPKVIAKAVQDYNLSREMLPTEALVHAEVWDALLQRMPYTAMIRNLGNMSKVGLLVPLSDAAKLVQTRLLQAEQLKKHRIHPVALLIAMKTYAQGHGMKGKGEWTAVPSIIDALDDAFYLAFDQIEPTGKRFLFGIDVSGSMSSQMGTLPISCAEGAAAMALACAKSESQYYIHGFAGDFVDLKITPKMRLDQALKHVQQRNFGTTDCAIPYQWAYKHKIAADAVVVITDNETYGGHQHPKQALAKYRNAINPKICQIVIGMTATSFSIADPADPLSVDIAGFDASVPTLIADFVRG